MHGNGHDSNGHEAKALFKSARILRAIASVMLSHSEDRDVHLICEAATLYAVQLAMDVAEDMGVCDDRGTDAAN